MQPQQPYQPTPPPAPGPTPPVPQPPATPGTPGMPPAQPQPNYDFIMNPAPPPRRSLFGGGNSMTSRILVVAVGVLALIIIGTVVINLFGKSGSIDKPAMLGILQDQTELARLSKLGTENGVSQTVKNFSISTQLTMASDQTVLVTYLKDQGYKPDPKTFGLKKDAAVTKQLDAAKSSSTFDVAYTDVMKDALKTYEQDLSKAYKTAGPNGKKLLNTDFKNTTLLYTQLTGEVQK